MSSSWVLQRSNMLSDLRACQFSLLFHTFDSFPYLGYLPGPWRSLSLWLLIGHLWATICRELGGYIKNICKHEVKVKVAQWCLTLCDPMDAIVYGILQARILESVAFPYSRGSSQSRDQTQVSLLQVDSLPVEPPGKPKNTGVAYPFSMDLPNPGIKQGLLHWGWILDQLNYQRSPKHEVIT